MSTERTITVKAAGGVLTMAELRAFVAELWPEDGPPITAAELSALKPKARVGFGGGIKSITVTVPGST